MTKSYVQFIMTRLLLPASSLSLVGQMLYRTQGFPNRQDRGYRALAVSTVIAR